LTSTHSDMQTGQKSTQVNASKYPTRKRTRLQGYDYSRQGAYFITVCTQNRAELFGHIVGANCVRPPCVRPPCVRPPCVRPPCVRPPCVRPFTELSETGHTVKHEIETLSSIYPTVHVSAFVIMPNHVHMVIVIDSRDIDGRPQVNGRPQVAPTVSRIIKQWKGSITKRLGFSPWQKSFHDHVIRNQDDYHRIAQYIENNPAQWQMDSLHPSKISRKKQEPE
jgi:putative transposase